MSPVSAAVLRSLHESAQGGDSNARDDLIVALLEHCQRILGRDYARVERSVVNDVVEDAILDYLAAPELYDPTRGRLDTYVVADARFRLLNRLRADRRRQRRDEIVARRELATAACNYIDVSMARRLGRKIMAAAKGREREFLLARWRGERRVEELARILGLEGAPDREKRLAVKRTTDRLRLRVKRLTLGEAESLMSSRHLRKGRSKAGS
jgi:hypothetical protein